MLWFKFVYALTPWINMVEFSIKFLTDVPILMLFLVIVTLFHTVTIKSKQHGTYFKSMFITSNIYRLHNI